MKELLPFVLTSPCCTLPFKHINILQGIVTPRQNNIRKICAYQTTVKQGKLDPVYIKEIGLRDLIWSILLRESITET